MTEKKDFIAGMQAEYDVFWGMPELKINVIQYIYDCFVYLTRNRLPVRKPTLFIHKLCKKYKLTHKTVLDVGSFTGYHSFYFHAERNNVTGIELSNKIAYGQKRFRRYGITFLKGDLIEQLNNIEDNSFDFIFSFYFPAHQDTGNIKTSEYMKSYLHKILPKLKKGGVFYSTYYSELNEKYLYPVSEADAIEFLQDNHITNYQLTNKLAPFDFQTLELIISRED